MSGLIHPVVPRAFPVTLGTLTFYATGWKLQAARNYTEQGGATGSCFLTNSCRRAKQLVLDGYFSFQSSPAPIIVLLENAMLQQTRFAFSMRNMRFTVTMLTKYTIQESATEGILPCQLTLVTTNNITEVTTSETDTDSTTEITSDTSTGTETEENA